MVWKPTCVPRARGDDPDTYLHEFARRHPGTLEVGLWRYDDRADDLDGLEVICLSWDGLDALLASDATDASVYVDEADHPTSAWLRAVPGRVNDPAYANRDLLVLVGRAPHTLRWRVTHVRNAAGRYEWSDGTSTRGVQHVSPRMARHLAAVADRIDDPSPLFETEG